MRRPADRSARPVRRLSAALVALGLAAVVTVGTVPVRAASRTVTITGGGWGHGIGMSQYGAYGRALKGKGPAAILEHYYSDANVTSRNMPDSIRVGLLQGKGSISVSSSAYREGGGKIVFKVSDIGKIAKGRIDDSFRVEPSGTGGMRLYKNGDKVKENGATVFGDPSTPIVLKYEPYDSLVNISDKDPNYAYGKMKFGTYSSTCGDGFCLRLVLALSMQKYLYGLGEVPASWPHAALEAQAIAGRTYAYEKVERSGQHRYPCDCAVYDSTLDQAYIGDSKRTGSGAYWDDWKGAVKATKDKVIVAGGDPIQALYSSSSGGHTEDNENVWGGTPLSYLRGVGDNPDDVDANPNHEWTVKMSWDSFESKLKSAFGMGNLEKFKLVKPFGVSGRVTVVWSKDEGGVKIVGSKKTVREDGWTIRSVLGLKDTLFRVDLGDGSSTVAGEESATGRLSGTLLIAPSGR